MAGLDNGNNGGLGNLVPSFDDGPTQTQPNPFDPFDPGDPDPIAAPPPPILTTATATIATPLPLTSSTAPLTTPTLVPSPTSSLITPTSAIPVPVVTVTSYSIPSSSLSASPTLSQSTDLSDNSGGFFQNKGLMTGVFTAAGLLGVGFVVAMIFLCTRRMRSRKMDREIAEAAIIDRNLRFPFEDDRDQDKYANSATTHYQENVAPSTYMQQNRNYPPPSVYSQQYSVAPSSNEWYPTSSAGHNGSSAAQDNYSVPPLPAAYVNRPLPNPFPGHVAGGLDTSYSALGAANYDSHQYPVLPQRQATGDYHPAALRPGGPSSPSSSELSSSRSSTGPLNPQYQAHNPALPLVAGVRRYSQAQGLQYLEEDPVPDTPNPFVEVETPATSPEHEIRPPPPLRAASVTSVKVRDNEDYGGRMDLKVVNE